MYGIVLVAIALGLSNFTAAIGIGLSGVDGRLRIHIAVVFGFFEAAMPLVDRESGSQYWGGRAPLTGTYAIPRD